MQSACSTKNRARHTACANCLLVNGCILSNAGSVSSNQAVTLGSGASRSRASYRSSVCNPSGVISYLPSRTISHPDLTISRAVCKEQTG